MRFKDIQKRIGVDRPALKPKPYADDTVKVGDRVRCKWEGHRAVIGTVIGPSSRHKECWVISVNKSDGYNTWTIEMDFNKCHCERIRSSEMSKVARGTLKPKHETDIYGDGDLE